MKKPSLLILFLLLLVAANTEIPELLHLSDNTSNDFSVNASQSRGVRCVCDEASVPPIPVDVPDQVHGHFWAWPSAKPSQVIAETNLLTLYSIHRT